MTVRTLQLPFTQFSYPGMSQDGKWMALPATDRSGRWSLYFMNLRGGEPREITSEPSASLGYADISPDGDEVVYVSAQNSPEVRVVPVLGGRSRRIAEIGIGPHWRPDGERIGYQLGGLLSRSGRFELWSVRPDGTDRRLEYVDSLSIGGSRICFAWSPDGKKIAWLRSFDSGAHQELIVRTLVTGKERQLTHDHKNIDEVWWTQQNEIVFSSNRAGSTNLWIIRASGGRPAQITKGLGPDIGMRVSADGKTVLCLQEQASDHLWIGDLDKGISHPVTRENLRLGIPSLSPDHQRIAVPIWDADPIKTTGDVYVMNRDGDARGRITSGDLSPLSAAWSPDGKWIAYDAVSIGFSFDSVQIYMAEANDPQNTRRLGLGRGPIWVDDSTLYITSRTHSRLISARDGSERFRSPDSLLEFPLRSGALLEVDFRHGREGQYWRPAGTSLGDPVTRRLLAKLIHAEFRRVFDPSRAALDYVRARDYMFLLDESGRPFALYPSDGKKVPVKGTFNGLSPQSVGSFAADGKEFVYLEPAVSSRLVLIENLK